MTTQIRLLLVLLAGAAPVGLGLGFAWPPALTVLSTATAVAGSALFLLWTETPGPRGEPRESPDDSEPLSAWEADPEQPARRSQIDAVAIESAVQGLEFVVSATVWWRPAHGAPDLPPMSREAACQNIAVSAVLTRMQAVARREHPARDELTRRLLQAALATPIPDVSGAVSAWAADVTVTADAEGLAHLRKVEEQARAAELWQREMARERERRAYLTDDVLVSTGSAVVWWLARHGDDVDGAVAMIGPLARISAAANNTEVAEPFRGYAHPEAADLARDEELAALLAQHVLVRLAERDTASGDAVAPPAGPAELLTGLLDGLGFAKDSAERGVFTHRILNALRAQGKKAEADTMEWELSRPDAARWAPGTPVPSGAPDGTGAGAGGEPYARHPAEAPAADPFRTHWTVDASGAVSSAGSVADEEPAS